MGKKKLLNKNRGFEQHTKDPRRFLKQSGLFFLSVLPPSPSHQDPPKINFHQGRTCGAFAAAQRRATAAHLNAAETILHGRERERGVGVCVREEESCHFLVAVPKKWGVHRWSVNAMLESSDKKRTSSSTWEVEGGWDKINRTCPACKAVQTRFWSQWRVCDEYI